MKARQKLKLLSQQVRNYGYCNRCKISLRKVNGAFITGHVAGVPRVISNKFKKEHMAL